MTQFILGVISLISMENTPDISLASWCRTSRKHEAVCNWRSLLTYEWRTRTETTKQIQCTDKQSGVSSINYLTKKAKKLGINTLMCTWKNDGNKDKRTTTLWRIILLRKKHVINRVTKMENIYVSGFFFQQRKKILDFWETPNHEESTKQVFSTGFR